MNFCTEWRSAQCPQDTYNVGVYASEGRLAEGPIAAYFNARQQGLPRIEEDEYNEKLFDVSSGVVSGMDRLAYRDGIHLEHSRLSHQHRPDSVVLLPGLQRLQSADQREVEILSN
jgi:hypothetical protein